MNIDGLGYATINQVIDRKWVEDPSDLYRLTKEQGVELGGFAPRSADKLSARIADSKRPSLGRFLYALGIPQVGEATADLLAVEFGSIEKLRAATADQLNAVEGIGPSMAGGAGAGMRPRAGARRPAVLRGAGGRAGGAPACRRRAAAGHGGPRRWAAHGQD